MHRMIWSRGWETLVWGKNDLIQSFIWVNRHLKKKKRDPISMGEGGIDVGWTTKAVSYIFDDWCHRSHMQLFSTKRLWMPLSDSAVAWTGHWSDPVWHFVSPSGLLPNPEDRTSSLAEDQSGLIDGEAVSHFEPRSSAAWAVQTSFQEAWDGGRHVKKCNLARDPWWAQGAGRTFLTYFFKGEANNNFLGGSTYFFKYATL